jgi:hypothetical protein
MEEQSAFLIGDSTRPAGPASTKSPTGDGLTRGGRETPCVRWRWFATTDSNPSGSPDGLRVDLPTDLHREMETPLRRGAHANFFIVRA